MLKSILWAVLLGHAHFVYFSQNSIALMRKAAYPAVSISGKPFQNLSLRCALSRPAVGPSSSLSGLGFPFFELSLLVL
jgi:hypothetical protein